MYAQGSPGYHTPYTSPYASPYTSPAMGGQLPRRPIPMPSGSAPATPSSGDARFAASHGFQYNARVATALLPCVLVLLGAGGPLVVGTLVAGLMISYILDALQFKNGAFVAIWFTFFTTAAALAFSGLGFAPHIPVIISVLILLTAMHLVFLCGVWVSLQFRWLQLEHPFVVLALERLLFACTPMTAIAIITYGLIAAIGAAHAPFYLMPCLFALYWLFSLPRASSFKSSKHTLQQQQQQARHGGKESSQDVWIIGAMEGLFHMMLVLFLPCGFHLAVHHNRIFESANEACDTLLLFFVPVLFVLYASKKGALNWLTTDKAKLKRVQILNGGFSLAVMLICFEIRVQILNGGFSLAVVLICFEIRVIFTSYGHYIHFPPPLNYLLVTLALFGLGFGFAAHMMGVLRGAVGSAVVTTVLLVSAVAGSLVIGMPVTVLPAPAIAAAYLAHYYTTGSITSYFIFAAASLLAAAWFVMDQYFALAIVFAGMTLKALCQEMLLALLLALLVPGAALFQKSQRVVGVIVVAQAFLFCRHHPQGPVPAAAARAASRPARPGSCPVPEVAASGGGHRGGASFPLLQQLLLALLLALLAPGAALFQKLQRVVGVIVVTQAFLLCRLESLLYNGEAHAEGGVYPALESLLYNGEAHAEGGVYPAFLVLATTVAGFVAMRKLRIAGKIGAVAEWVGICLYLSKLPMLVVHSQGVLLGSQLLLLAISPPFFLYQDKSRPGLRMKPWMAVMHAALVLLTVLFCRYVISLDKARPGSRMKPWMAVMHAALVLLTVLFCRYVIFDVISRPGSRMKPWMAVMHAALVLLTVLFCRYVIFDVIVSASGHKPSHALLIGSLGLIAIAGCLPIGALHFPNSLVSALAGCLPIGVLHFPNSLVSAPTSWRRTGSGSVSALLNSPTAAAPRMARESEEGGSAGCGNLSAVPNSPAAAAPRMARAIPIAKVSSDGLVGGEEREVHFPDDDPDDATIYGQSVEGPVWPVWPVRLLLGTIVSALAAFFSAFPIAKSVEGPVWPVWLLLGTIVSALAAFFSAIPITKRAAHAAPIRRPDPAVSAAVVGAGAGDLVDNGDGEEVPDFYEETRLEDSVRVALGRATLVDNGDGEEVPDFYEETRLEVRSRGQDGCGREMWWYTVGSGERDASAVPAAVGGTGAGDSGDSGDGEPSFEDGEPSFEDGSLVLRMGA
ncbi:unnamed protein product [Closterium sp. NIES-64]|nr:unnamed protein product [Closterium sp. NIES-64]